jgi:hypothetical protein
MAAVTEESKKAAANYEEDDRLIEIRVSIKAPTGFTTISDYLTIVDMPGIEDGYKSECIKSYIEENQ